MAAEQALEAEISIEIPPVRLRPCPRCRQVAPGWMTTFADMATLLMALFALMYNFAEMDQKEKSGSIGLYKCGFWR